VARLRRDRLEAARDQAAAALALARAAKNAAESERARTRAEYGRQKELFDKGIASLETLAKYRTAYEVAEARLAEAAASIERAEANLKAATVELSRTIVATPTDGIVVKKFVEEGELVSPGGPIATIECLEKVKVVVRVNEADLAYATPGAEARVTFDALGGRAVTAAVTDVVPSGDPATRSFKVTIEVDSAAAFGPDIADWAKPGMFARVEIPRGERRLAVVPEDALVLVDGRYFVWVVSDGRARRRRVEVWARPPGRAAISEGLEAGETVVTTGAALLAEGAPVAPEHAGRAGAGR
jgi:membrane fusion protein (multidrug efflux system)